MARPLNARNLGRFLTFNGRESNWHFDSWPLLRLYNLCYMYSNGSCEPILDIYVLRAFQWYKYFFNPLNFDLSNYFLKNKKSIEIPTPKVRAHLGVCGFIPSHYPTLLRVWMWLPSCILSLHLSMPLALLVSLRLGSWQKKNYSIKYQPTPTSWPFRKNVYIIK